MQLPEVNPQRIQTDVEAQLENANNEIARLQRIVQDPEVVRMGKIYMDETVRLANHSPAAFRVLMVMLGKMTRSNSLLISNSMLEKLTEQSNSTVKRAIRLLREQDWIEVVKTGASNVYRVNSNIFWHDSEHGKIAEITANVILDFDEQDEATRARIPNQYTRHIPLANSSDYPTVDPQTIGSQQSSGL